MGDSNNNSIPSVMGPKWYGATELTDKNYANPNEKDRLLERLKNWVCANK